MNLDSDTDALSVSSTRGSVVAWLTIGALLVGVLSMALIIRDEPLHIDELRQVRMYERESLEEVAADAFTADQPPLDHWLNTLVRRIIGPGDSRARLLPAIWGLISLLAIAWFARRQDLGAGVPVTVLYVALSPILLTLTAYARPYALPILLTLVFLFATDVWLRSRSEVAAVCLVMAALVLPWTRTADPLIILAAAVFALLVRRFAQQVRDMGSVWLPIIAAVVAIVGVGLPIMAKLPRQGYGGVSDDLDVSRILTEVPQAWASAIPLFLVTLAITGVLLLLSSTRRTFLEWWWLWVLFALPVGFAIAFVLTTDEPSRYWPRYAISWVVPLAFVLGLATKAAENRIIRSRFSLTGVALVVGVAAVIGATAIGLVGEVSSTSRHNWEIMANEIEHRVSPEATILFYDVVHIEGYFTRFAAAGRYLDDRYRVDSVMNVARDADRLHNDGPIVMVTFREPIDVPGWTKTKIDIRTWMYEPPVEISGVEAVIDTLLLFSEYTEPRQGVGLVAAAATLVADIESNQAGCVVLDRLRPHPGLHEAAMRSAEYLAGEMLWMLECRSG